MHEHDCACEFVSENESQSVRMSMCERERERENLPDVYFLSGYDDSHKHHTKEEKQDITDERLL